MKAAPVILITLSVALAACGDQKTQPAAVIRPVLSVVVTPQTSRTLGFAGTIEPQVRSELGFRVLGRMITRDVSVGAPVKKGAQLAALDPLPFELAVRSAQADLSNALAQLENATATETRQQTLLERNVSSDAQFEAAQQAREAAAAAVTRARSGLTKAQEQLNDTRLLADFDGVVTATSAEPGQVIQPGKAVVTLARPDIREAVVDVPTDISDGLAGAPRFEVSLQLDPSVKASGTVREIAPQADAATRTRRVKIALENPPSSFRLGTIITATVTAAAAPHIQLPLSALLERDGKTLVWVVDMSANTVSTREVKIAARDNRSFQVVDGLAPGTRVVTAGVNSLTPGQAVKIANEASR